MDEMETLTLEIDDASAGERLDKVLTTALPDFSRVQIQAMIKEGGALVNGKPAKPALRLENGDKVELALPVEGEDEDGLAPESIALEVLYEDAYVLALNKPAGLVVHPGVGNPSGTLVNALLARWPQVREVGDPERAGIVHRLDKDTSGVILVALHPEAQEKLMAQFQAREVKKVYWALTERHPQTPTGRIDAPIGRDTEQRKRMAVMKGGKEAVTNFRTLKTYQQQALLEIEPETGRTHQIRVHLAFIGAPVVGDRVYGFRKQGIKLSRLFLHAKSITFTHPMTGETLLIDTELPEKLENVLKNLPEE